MKKKYLLLKFLFLNFLSGKFNQGQRGEYLSFRINTEVGMAGIL